MSNDLPKIKVLTEIGETPFQVAKVEEKILQGWDKTSRRSLYLFKGPTQVWSYYSKRERCIVEVPQWRDAEALIEGVWVKMSVYWRLQLRFETPVEYTSFEEKVKTKKVVSEAIVVVTGAAYESLEEQFKGRPEGSWYKFSYKKLKNGRSYVDKVSFVK